VPIYEFQCGSCGERFEELVAAGTASVACRQCGNDTERVLSAQAAQQRLVRSSGDARKQERKNAKLHASAKSDFKRRLSGRRARRGSGEK
jgi:putative FmdB family regulatory protein